MNFSAGIKGKIIRKNMIKDIFGKKIGMTQIFKPQGDLVGVTLVEIEPVCILEKVDYPNKSVVKIGILKVKKERIDKTKKPILGYYNKLKLSPYKFIREVAVEKGTDLSFLKEVEASEGISGVPSQEVQVTGESKTESAPQKESKAEREVGVEIFKEGDIVHVRAKTKGRGFAGGMKRHGWHGQPMAHGSMSHRRIGSVGSNTYPGRIRRGLRMPGHMGDSYCTLRNLEVVKIDKEKNLVFIKGSIPGSRGNLVRIRKAASAEA